MLSLCLSSACFSPQGTPINNNLSLHLKIYDRYLFPVFITGLLALFLHSWLFIVGTVQDTGFSKILASSLALKSHISTVLTCLCWVLPSVGCCQQKEAAQSSCEDLRDRKMSSEWRDYADNYWQWYPSPSCPGQVWSHRSYPHRMDVLGMSSNLILMLKTKKLAKSEFQSCRRQNNINLGPHWTPSETFESRWKWDVQTLSYR